MMSEFYTHPKGDLKAPLIPASFWFYMGDGDWVAVDEESKVSRETKARRLMVSRPIDQLPRDGVLMYRTPDDRFEMRRVIEGAID